jgi:KDO2-lipid IV(A) lauroyltransferase
VDLPIARKSQRLMFFGHPAPLPVGHIRLALRAGVPVRVAAIQQRPDKTYLVDISDPIPMQPHPDQSTEIQQNAEAVLKVLASYIQKTPDQWLMFFPVWKELLPEVP